MGVVSENSVQNYSPVSEKRFRWPGPLLSKQKTSCTTEVEHESLWFLDWFLNWVFKTHKFKTELLAKRNQRACNSTQTSPLFKRWTWSESFCHKIQTLEKFNSLGLKTAEIAVLCVAWLGFAQWNKHASAQHLLICIMCLYDC